MYRCLAANGIEEISQQTVKDGNSFIRQARPSASYFAEATLSMATCSDLVESDGRVISTDFGCAEQEV